MLKNKKIVHISPVFQKKDQYNFEGLVNGGGGRYVSELALNISKHYDTTLITFGESDYVFKYKTLNIKIVKCTPFLKNFNGDANFVCLKLFYILRNFDIIHTHQYYSDTTLIACLAGILFRKKVFVTDLGFRGINISRYIPMKYICNKVLVLTAYEKHIFGLTDSQCDVIHGGVDLKKYSYSTDKKRKVIFIGRLLPHKGINYLIEALDPEVECVIAGHNSHKEYFGLLQKLSQGKNIQFLLSASDDEIIAHLKESSVLVLPSVDRDVYGTEHKNAELFGLVIAEAFACGTPVIVSDSSALPYVVDEGINGFIVNQNNPDQIKEKISLLLGDNQLVAKMGMNARKKVKKYYDWQKIAQKCIEIYISNL